jgi:hypothetical protein
MDLKSVLQSISGSRIVSLRTKTQVKLNKKSRVTGAACPYVDGVSKLSVKNCIIGTDYANSVNNQLAREDKIGDFQPEKLWKGKGRRISKFLVEHTESGQNYLAILPKTDANNCNITKSVYVNNTTGLEINPENLKDFLPPYNESSSQGTEKTIHWEVIKLENILGLKSGEIDWASQD